MSASQTSDPRSSDWRPATTLRRCRPSSEATRFAAILSPSRADASSSLPSGGGSLQPSNCHFAREGHRGRSSGCPVKVRCCVRVAGYEQAVHLHRRQRWALARHEQSGDCGRRAARRKPRPRRRGTRNRERLGLDAERADQQRALRHAAGEDRPGREAAGARATRSHARGADSHLQERRVVGDDARRAPPDLRGNLEPHPDRDGLPPRRGPPAAPLPRSRLARALRLPDLVRVRAGGCAGLRHAARRGCAALRSGAT